MLHTSNGCLERLAAGTVTARNARQNSFPTQEFRNDVFSLPTTSPPTIIPLQRKADIQRLSLVTTTNNKRYPYPKFATISLPHYKIRYSSPVGAVPIHASPPRARSLPRSRLPSCVDQSSAAQGDVHVATYTLPSGPVPSHL